MVVGAPPFTLRLTELTPRLSLALTATVILTASSVCPWVGEVIVTLGGVTSGPFTIGFGGRLPFISEPCVSRADEIINGTLLTTWGSSSTTPPLRTWLDCGCWMTDCDTSFLQEVQTRVTAIKAIVV